MWRGLVTASLIKLNNSNSPNHQKQLSGKKNSPWTKDVYSESSQPSRKKRLKTFVVFVKSSIINILLGFEFISEETKIFRQRLTYYSQMLNFYIH